MQIATIKRDALQGLIDSTVKLSLLPNEDLHYIKRELMTLAYRHKDIDRRVLFALAQIIDIFLETIE